MDFDFTEKILNLFCQCKSSGRSLEININDDLLPILPIQRKLLINILREPPISSFSSLSSDEKKLIFQNKLSLCQTHRNQSDSSLFSCSKLHFCEEFLLNNQCQQLKSTGQCSSSHSLTTKHNQIILSKFNLSPEDEYIFSLISKLTKLSKEKSSKFYIQTLNQQSMDEQFLQQLFVEHQSLIKNKQLINSNTLLLEFEDDEISSMMENYLIAHHSKRIQILKSLPMDFGGKDGEKLVDLHRISVGRGRGRIPVFHHQQTNTSSMEHRYRLSHRLNSSENLHQTSTTSPARLVPRNANSPLIKYSYSKPFTAQQICFLLGPGRQSIVENDQCQIVSDLIFNYCHVQHLEQGQEIEENLYSVLPKSIRSEILSIPRHLLLFVNSSAAEQIFRQNRDFFGICTEPIKTSINIEINPSKTNVSRQGNEFEFDQSRSSSVDEEESFSDGKFHIKSSGSSIDVVSGDISQIPVDVMICISTSNNLCSNILRRAGSFVESEYKQKHSPNHALILNGGETAAKTILFVPWETQVDPTELIEIQKSLSDLVRWCIDQAHQKQFKSISFPPIGTGQLGLDPGFVCEAMISAASECLHARQLDVLFVVYPTKDSDEDECYQIFRIYLDSLCEQVQPKSKSNKCPNQSLKKEIQSRKVSLFSDASRSNFNPNQLLKAFEEVLYEKTIDLALIDPSYRRQIENLIETCLKSNVYPTIDYSRQEMKLTGDRHSCYQCFFNLKTNKEIYQYTYEYDQNQTYLLNTFVSLNIDLASAFGETKISVEENDRLIYHIDLVQSQMKLNNEKKTYSLRKNKKFSLKSSLTVSTNPIDKSSYPSLECAQEFYRTMSNTDWIIDRIESIDNPLLKSHFDETKTEKIEVYYYSCDYSSVQSIVLYGLHRTNTYAEEIYLSKTICNCHQQSRKSSTDGKYYLFTIQVAKDNGDKDLLLLKNDEISLTLPIYLTVYEPRNLFH